jgi:hypothetical protein
LLDVGEFLEFGAWRTSISDADKKSLPYFLNIATSALSAKNGLILTGNDAELLSRALSEIKIKVYEESKAA